MRSVLRWPQCGQVSIESGMIAFMRFAFAERIPPSGSAIRAAGKVSPRDTARRCGACTESAQAQLSGAARSARCALARARFAGGSPTQAQPIGHRPQAGRLFGEPAAWRPAAVWSSSGRRRHGAASGARPAGLGGPGGAGGGGRVRAGVALACGLQRKPHDSAVGGASASSSGSVGTVRLYWRHLALAARIVAVWRLVWRFASLGREGEPASAR